MKISEDTPTPPGFVAVDMEVNTNPIVKAVYLAGMRDAVEIIRKHSGLYTSPSEGEYRSGIRDAGWQVSLRIQELENEPIREAA